MAVQTSPEQPFQVAHLNSLLKGWIDRLGTCWVEGQLTEINVRPNWRNGYAVLRDLEQEHSVRLTFPAQLVAANPLKAGDRIIIEAKPNFYQVKGDLSLWVTQIRHTGIGQLLAQMDALRKQLATEGLTSPNRKKPLPLLPKCIGLITGKDSAAERDVKAVATDRWPAVKFKTLYPLVQGAQAPSQVGSALQQFERDPEVDVIIVARGGGSVEELMPFSDERLVRYVTTLTTPVVSAIGHEPDHPVLDDVADVRAATPTDAAKRVVPDTRAESQYVQDLQLRGFRAMENRLQAQENLVLQLRTRPVLKSPAALVELQAEKIAVSVNNLRRIVKHQVETTQLSLDQLAAKLQTLGPEATFARGYSIVQVLPKDPSAAPFVLTSVKDVTPGGKLRVRLKDGGVQAVTLAVEVSAPPAAPAATETEPTSTETDQENG